MESMAKNMWKDIVGLEFLREEDIADLYDKIKSSVHNMKHPEFEDFFRKWEAAHDEEPPEDDDDDPEILVDWPDRIFLPRIYDLFNNSGYTLHDEITYDAMRDAGVNFYKYFMDGRAEHVNIMTRRLLKRIIENNGDLHKDLTPRECDRVDRIMKRYGNDQVWATLSKYNFFVKKFGCAPRQFFDRRAKGLKIKEKKSKAPKRAGGFKGKRKHNDTKNV
jgi:hypothetical protein